MTGVNGARWQVDTVSRLEERDHLDRYGALREMLRRYVDHMHTNAPYLFGRHLWAETRIPLFEQATDTRPEELKEQGVRPRVWFGERWITSVFDLFEENIRYFPALLPICESDARGFASLFEDSGTSPSCAHIVNHKIPR